MASSAILVHLSGGYIEFHFHFFLMLAFLALLQDWVLYILAILFVVLHHGVIVLNTAAAREDGLFSAVNDEQKQWLAKMQATCLRLLLILGAWSRCS